MNYIKTIKIILVLLIIGGLFSVAYLFYTKYSEENFYISKSDTNLYIPKIMHRLWTVWDPKQPRMPKEYQEFDVALKNLHPNWQFMEWDEDKVIAFIKEFYPDFLPVYLSYDSPTKKHDASRYLIVRHFGGVFIQHSIKLQKNLEPLLIGADLVVARQTTDPESGYANGFFASIPRHKFWDYHINSLPDRVSLYVLDATGPAVLTNNLRQYLKDTQDSGVKILHSKHLFPFSWEEKDAEIKAICRKDHDKCFKLFPESYGFCLWTGSWIK